MLELVDIFGPYGPLSRALPGFVPRPQQREMAQRIGTALTEGECLNPLLGYAEVDVDRIDRLKAGDETARVPLLECASARPRPSMLIATARSKSRLVNSTLVNCDP